MGNTYAEKIAALTAGGNWFRTRDFDSSDLLVGIGRDRGVGHDGDTGLPVLPVLEGNTIKFTIAALSYSGSAGYYYCNYSPARDVLFGANSVHCVQYQEKFSRFLIEHIYVDVPDGAGFKSSIISSGDPPGPTCEFGGATTGCKSSNVEIEHVVTAYNYLARFPVAYHHDMSMNAVGWDVSFPTIYSSSDFKVQNAVDRGAAFTDVADRYCLYSQREDNFDYGGCLSYSDGLVNPLDPTTSWATITQRFTLGDLVSDIFQNCRYELWWAWEGQPALKLMDSIHSDPSGYQQRALDGQNLGKAWLLPYWTSKGRFGVIDAGQDAYVWYKHLIISEDLPILTTDEVPTSSLLAMVKL